MENKVSFLTFFLMWAKVQGWTVPLLHVRICQWLEDCTSPVRVVMIFRGAAKSTIYAVYKAWKLYREPRLRSLIWAADGDLAKKLTRDTINILRRHPLCAGMLPTKPGAQAFWVSGSIDPRNASMTAVGVNQNVTSARADDIDYDDVEVPKNIRTAEARENLRNKTQESTFIAVPGAQETYIGTRIPTIPCIRSRWRPAPSCSRSRCSRAAFATKTPAPGRGTGSTSYRAPTACT